MAITPKTLTRPHQSAGAEEGKKIMKNVTYIISAYNDQGAYAKGGVSKSLSGAVKQARETFSKGWKIEIYESIETDVGFYQELVKFWTIRK